MDLHRKREGRNGEVRVPPEAVGPGGESIEGDSMRYMMLVYTKETDNPDAEELKTVAAGHRVVMDETAKRGIFYGADPLAPTSTATTVRVDQGRVMVTD